MADQTILTSLPVPTQDERTMAFLAHLLQVFTGFIAPLVIFCVKQDSRFVKLFSAGFFGQRIECIHAAAPSARSCWRAWAGVR